jgi:hypothetical protein
MTVAGLVASTCADKKRSAQVVLFALVVAAIAAVYGGGIRINTNLTALLPETAPTVAALDELGERKGNTDVLTIAIEEPDAVARQQMVDALADEVRGWSETERVHLGRDFTPLRDRALFFLEQQDLAKLRDTLVKERRRAVARVIRPGLTDDGDEPDPDQFLAGDDWDSIGDEDGEEEEEEAPPSAPANDEAGPGDEDFDLRKWLEEQKGELNELGTLSEREIDLIWLDENEDGELVWEDTVTDPYVSNEGTVQLVKANLSLPPTNVEFATEVSRRIEEAVATARAQGIAPDARVEIVSSYNITKDVNTILVDAKRATIMAGVLVVLVLVIGFRRFRALVLVVVPMGVATCMTLAVARAMYEELNALTVFLFAVLFGMGVDFAVHLYALRRQQGKVARWGAVVAGHFRPLVSTMLTTAGSLLVLSVAEFKAFREFGLVSAIGVALCFVCALFLLPALDVLLGPDKGPHPAKTSKKTVTIAEPRSWKNARMLALAGIAVFSIAGGPDAAFEKDIRQLKVQTSKNKKGISYGSASGRCSKSLVLVADDSESLDAAVEALDEERREQRTLPGGIVRPGQDELQPWIRGVYSVRIAMPTDQASKREINKEIAEQTNAFLLELPDRDEEARQYQTHLEGLEKLALHEPLEAEELPDWALEPFMEKDGHHDRLAHVCLYINNDHLDELVAVDRRLQELVGAHGVRHADNRLVFADLIVNIEKDSKRLPIVALVVILAFIGLDLRRPLDTLACFGTLALGLGLAVGLMGAWPIHLNFFNLVVMPAVVGLGIDASIHLWHARTKPTLHATAKASLLAALTTVAGFSGLLVARHPGLHSIGVLGVVAVTACIGVAFLALYPLRRR